ncbi:MAG: hypothetical protein M0C28_18710 [Candidatus Moduliflexus flocculans]|nr:hypothetical protein [Candidatus Moduliflexus flocculans]
MFILLAIIFFFPKSIKRRDREAIPPVRSDLPMTILVKNGLRILGSDIVKADVLILDGKIAALGPPTAAADATIDAAGAYVAPGFVDVHVHGGGGHDFMEATPEAFLSATEHHLFHGTTAIVPTAVSAPVAD